MSVYEKLIADSIKCDKCGRLFHKVAFSYHDCSHPTEEGIWIGEEDERKLVVRENSYLYEKINNLGSILLETRFGIWLRADINSIKPISRFETCDIDEIDELIEKANGKRRVRLITKELVKGMFNIGKTLKEKEHYFWASETDFNINGRTSAMFMYKSDGKVYFDIACGRISPSPSTFWPELKPFRVGTKGLAEKLENWKIGKLYVEGKE